MSSGKFGGWWFDWWNHRCDNNQTHRVPYKIMKFLPKGIVSVKGARYFEPGSPPPPSGSDCLVR